MTMAKKQWRGREPAARALRRKLVTDALVDQLFKQADERGVSLTGKGGVLP